MQGKILANGLISGNDGLRYTFKPEDVKNVPENSSIEALIGAEVDFEGKDGVAKDIYTIKKSFDLKNTQQKLLSTDLQSTKIKAYIAVACAVCSTIPYFGLLFFIGAVVLFFLVILAVKEHSKSTTLLKNLATQMAEFIIGVLIVWVSLFGTIMSVVMSRGFNLNEIGALSVVCGVIGILLIVSSFYSFYLVAKELAFVSGQPYFMYAFWCALFGTITTALFFVGFVLLAVAAVFYVLAWHKTTHIGISYSAKGYKAGK